MPKPETIEAIAAIASATLSLLALIFTARSFILNRAKIKLRVVDNGETSATLFQPDRVSATDPDVFWNEKFRVAFDVVIENSSAKPVSIEDIALDHKFHVLPYVDYGEKYIITRKRQHYDSSDFLKHDGLSELVIKTSIFAKGITFKPVVNMDPYSAVRCLVLFSIGNNDVDGNIGAHTLTVVSSRKNWDFQVKISHDLRTVLSPEEQYSSDLPTPTDLLRQ